VLGHIRRQELLKAGDRVGVAVSGGIDSIALLRLLLELRTELGIVVSVVHFNHKLRGADSDGDEEFVRSLARDYDLEFSCDGGEVAKHAHAEGVSVETAARELRYGFFRNLLHGEPSPQGLKPPSVNEHDGTAKAVPLHEASSLRSAPQGFPSSLSRHRSDSYRVDKIATGHTLDDQAETVLMRLIRGAGLKGMGGIYPRIVVEDDDGETGGEIVRPLLAFRRRELEDYLHQIGQNWREDATNSDTSFTRNRVRKLLIPLLENEFNPGIAGNIAELAEIARGEEDFWENEVSGWMGTGVHWSEPEWARSAHVGGGLVQIGMAGQAAPGEPAASDLQSQIEDASWLVANASVDLRWFLGEPLAVQRRIIKAIGEHAGIPLEFKHVEEILRFAGEETGSGKELQLPLGWRVERDPDHLVFLTPDLREPPPLNDYEYDLPVPGYIEIGETGSRIEARRVAGSKEKDAGYNPEHLLDADSLSGPFKVRNWRAGDRYWPQHTKSPKKIKELLQERHVARLQRKLWPVVVSGDEIIWLRGFPPPARFAAKSGRDAVLILETSFDAPD
jgi:tRNA(Ile)-lysidine synthase